MRTVDRIALRKLCPHQVFSARTDKQIEVYLHACSTTSVPLSRVRLRSIGYRGLYHSYARTPFGSGAGL